MTIRPVFTKAFYQLDTFATPPSSPKIAPQAQEPVIFNEQPKQFARFQASSAFDRCQSEYTAILDRIMDFAEKRGKELKPPLQGDSLAKIKANFGQLKNNLVDMKRDQFSNHKPTVYGKTKERFHELDRLLKNENIPVQQRMNAIQAMTPDMPQCSGGIYTAVSDAVSSLKSQIGGMRGQFHLHKLKMIDNLIFDHIKKTHIYRPIMEKHYINAYFNRLADELGVRKRIDDFALSVDREITDQFEKACRQLVLSKLKPSALATSIANSYVDELKSVTEKVEMDLTKPVSFDDYAAMKDVIRLSKEDHLDAVFGKIDDDYYLQPTAEHDASELVTEPILLAELFMKDMQERKLVDFADTVRLIEGKTDSNDQKIEGDLMQLGDLYWRKLNGRCEPVKAQDLLNVSPRAIAQSLKKEGKSAQECEERLKSVAEQVLDAVMGDKDDLKYVPKKWLEEFVEIFTFSDSENKGWIQPVATLAASGNHINVLKALSDAGANLDTANDLGWTPLICAAENGCIESVDFLIEKGAAVNAVCLTGSTPALRAIAKGHAEVLKTLHKHGADLHRPFVRGTSPVAMAAWHGYTGVLQVLSTAKVDFKNVKASDTGATPIIIAAHRGHAEALEFLVNREDADIHAKDRSGAPALSAAASAGHLDTVTILVRKYQEKMQDPTQEPHTLESMKQEMSAAAGIAAGRGHFKILKHLLENGADIGYAGHNQLSLAGYAAQFGHAEILDYLISKGADITSPDALGFSPMMHAANGGHLAAVKLLHENKINKVDLNTPTITGTTPLMLAAKSGNVELLDYMVEQGAGIHPQNNGGCSALSYATIQGKVDAMKFLIRMGASPLILDKSSNSLACLAAAYGRVGALKCLADLNMDLTNSRNEEEETPFYLAVKHGKLDAVKFLAEHGAVPTNPGPDSRPLAVMATESSTVAVMRYLIENGLTITGLTMNGETLLMRAALRDRPDMLKLLLEKNVISVNARGPYNYTAAAFAVEHNKLESLKALLEKGARLDRKVKKIVDYTDSLPRTRENVPLLMLAAELGHAGIVRFLLNQGMDVNERDSVRNTALMRAALEGHAEIVTMLIENGASIQAQNSAQHTARKLAEHNGHHAVVEALKNGRARKMQRPNPPAN